MDGGAKLFKIKTVIKFILNLTKLRKIIDYYLLKMKITKHIKAGTAISYQNFNLFQDYNENLIFIHIPKAAGMSVVKTLYGKSVSNHASANDYIKQNKYLFKKAYSFAITRNPYTRAFSAYNYLQAAGMNPIDKVWKDIFIKKYETFESFLINGGLKYAIDNDAQHFIPQHKFIFDEKDVSLCNFIGQIEEMKDVEKHLTTVLGVEITFSKVNVTSSNSIDINKIYTKKMLRVVNELYGKDFNLLGYTKIWE